MGSTPHAHAMAKVKHPHEQGVVAMTGVFIDTFVVLREWLDSVSQEDREAFCDALYSILSMGGRAKTFEDLRKGGFSGWAALWKEYAGADERKKQILTEIFGRLAIDVKDELMKAAGQGLRSAGHGIRTVGQNLMGRREPDKTQTK